MISHGKTKEITKRITEKEYEFSFISGGRRNSATWLIRSNSLCYLLCFGREYILLLQKVAEKTFPLALFCA